MANSPANNPLDLKEQVALVTGGSRGIGRRIALTLAQAGAHVAINFVSNRSLAEEVVEQIRSLGRQSLCVQADVKVEEQVSQMVEEVSRELGKINILVNNAGVTRDNLIMRMSREEWQEVVDVNLTGAFLCSRAVVRDMVKQRSGAIINISSVVGLRGNPGQSNYCSAKAGLIGLTKSLARELASRNIRVNAVAPGYILTDMTERLSEELKSRILDYIPLGSFGDPQDVADAVLFLASPMARYITGQIILVDGGMGI
ncbi:3-oxoacyl-[acyl-carrier protein] reductase [Candidatus Hakubella thermalkaliphila]|nr:3-oxoacyl-[acyl-carrier protein] reductase [Candidatus Hakubella thermalkaliphila]